MKLIVVGANGFVATEILRQSLRLSAIGEVVAVSRSEVSPPSKPYPNTNLSKLRVVKVDDYDIYTDATKEAFAGADACIWSVLSIHILNHLSQNLCLDIDRSLLTLLILSRTVAITPSKSKKYPFEEVKRVCHDSTIKGFTAMTEFRSKDGEEIPAFRFMYMSGIAAERDQTKKPDWMPEYSLMRVSTFLPYRCVPSSKLGFLSPA